MKLEKRTVLVTGGTSGIGLELAKNFYQRGNAVILTGRDENKLDAVRHALPGVHTFKSDVGDPAAIATLYGDVVSRFPSLDILINNAGIMRQINLHQARSDIKDLTREIDIDLTGPIRMVAQFLPHLKAQESAAIVNVSSGLAFLPAPQWPVYCAAKAGIHSFTISLRAQLKRTNVRVFELAPPLTMTPLATGATDAEDLKGIPIMSAEKLARRALEGMEKDKLEIRPGLSNVMKLTGRLAPNWLLRRMIDPTVARMLSQNSD
jgi:uncharacterized oxidoreductase